MGEITIEEAWERAVGLHQAGRLAEAEGLYRAILEKLPGHEEVLHLLGVVIGQRGDVAGAIGMISEAIGRAPNGVYYSNLSRFLMDAGRVDEAVEAGRRAVEMMPGLGDAYVNLGRALDRGEQTGEAVEVMRRGVGIAPGHADLWRNLGVSLARSGRHREAIEAYREALKIVPGMGDAWTGIGACWEAFAKLDEAEAAYREALKVAGAAGGAGAWNNLGNVLKNMGRMEEAVSCFQEGLKVGGTPEVAGLVHDNLVYALHFLPGEKWEVIGEELTRWHKRWEMPVAGKRRHANNRQAGRRLRVGYVSPDFREHSVGRFILPLLLGHDRERFEVICYSDVEKEDALTARMRGAVSAWRDIRGMPDEAVARLVEEDGVDILVDLTMHMAHNRLRVFARKPAPVQVTYLAYVSSTGMKSMDYRLSDPYLDPVGEERAYVEATMRLPTSYWCYQQSLATPEVGELPLLKAGRVTFGSLSNFCKVNDRAVEAWGRILARVPGSRLVLWAGEGKHRERVWRQMEGLGVERGRVEFVKFEPAAGYFGRYGEIDVGLDPFPYAGGTTTCDALWMGVPVVTLAGKLGVGRGGVSILSNVGLKELIAQDVEEYVEIATKLAGDVEKLKGLRAGLRERMQRSPLMDAQRLVREVEDAYREMWKRFCRE